MKKIDSNPRIVEYVFRMKVAEGKITGPISTKGGRGTLVNDKPFTLTGKKMRKPYGFNGLYIELWASTAESVKKLQQLISL